VYTQRDGTHLAQDGVNNERKLIGRTHFDNLLTEVVSELVGHRIGKRVL